MLQQPQTRTSRKILSPNHSCRKPGQIVLLGLLALSLSGCQLLSRASLPGLPSTKQARAEQQEAEAIIEKSADPKAVLEPGKVPEAPIQMVEKQDRLDQPLNATQMNATQIEPLQDRLEVTHPLDLQQAAGAPTPLPTPTPKAPPAEDGFFTGQTNSILYGEAPKSITPTTRKQPVDPTPVTEAIKTSVPSGDFAVHLASYRDEQNLIEGWRIMQNRDGDLLGGLQAIESRVTISGKGEFLRLKAGPIASREMAEKLCDDIRARGDYCAVMEATGTWLALD